MTRSSWSASRSAVGSSTHLWCGRPGLWCSRPGCDPLWCSRPGCDPLWCSRPGCDFAGETPAPQALRHTFSSAVVKAALALIACFASQLAAPSIASADTTVVPGALTAVEGDGNNNNPLINVGATAQLLISSSQLGAITPGSTITGIRFRLNAGLGAAPAVAATWTDYEITLAQLATTIPTASSVFASNMTSPVLVRDGSLMLPTSSFPSGGTPNNFGPLVSFNQTAYTYAGGDLVVLIGHDASNLSGTIAVDSATTATSGYNTAFRALNAGAFQALAASNSSSSFPVIQFEFTPVPEPSALALLALAALTRLPRRLH